MCFLSKALLEGINPCQGNNLIIINCKIHNFCLRSALSVPYRVRNNGLKLRLYRNLSLKIMSLYAEINALGCFGLVRDSFVLTLLLSFFSFTSTHRYAAFPLPCLSFTFTHIHTQRLSSSHSSFHMTLLGRCSLYLCGSQ